MSDDAFMAAALSLGRRNMGRTAPNPAVGALLVKDGVVVGRGWTAPGGRPHAETEALAEAGEAARGATLYVTLEPCSHHGATPPCASAIIAAGVARVVSAMEDPDPRVAGRGHALLEAAGVAVTTGIRTAEARRDHLGHVRRATQGRPMVTLKLAQTPDGFAAGARHDARLRITGPVADNYTHMQRLLHDAIMIGIGTAREDDPLMTVRLPGVSAAPLRVVLDTQLDLSPRSRLAATARDAPILVVVGDAVEPARIAEFCAATGIDVVRAPLAATGRLDLAEVLRILAARGVTRVFSEGGPRIAAALVLEGLADAVILHTGPKPFGGAGLPALTPTARGLLADPARYRLAEERMLGADRMTRHEAVTAP